MSHTNLLIGAAFLTGAMVPFQLAFNAQLGMVTKSPYTAGLIIFLIGAVAMTIAVVTLRHPFPNLGELMKAPPTIWLGGMIATFYILAVVIVTPKLGVGTTAVLIISGQVLMALLLDHLGAFGSPVHELNWPRIIGALLIIVGVVSIRTN